MPAKRKTTLVPYVSPPRAIKRPRRAKAIATPIVVDPDSSDCGGVEEYVPTPDQSPDDDDENWEDEAEPEEGIAPPVASTSKGKARAVTKKAPASKAPASKAPASKAPASKAPASKAPASKGKKAKVPAGPYGTRKQVFHWLHFHVRSMIQSFGELEQIRIIQAQSERARINAQRKLLREEKEKTERVLGLEIELEKLKAGRYMHLGARELATEYELLAQEKQLEVQRAEDRTKAVEIKLAELQIDLEKAHTATQEAIKDRMAIENQLLRAKLEVAKTGK